MSEISRPQQQVAPSISPKAKELGSGTKDTVNEMVRVKDQAADEFTSYEKGTIEDFFRSKAPLRNFDDIYTSSRQDLDNGRFYRYGKDFSQAEGNYFSVPLGGPAMRSPDLQSEYTIDPQTKMSFTKIVLHDEYKEDGYDEESSSLVYSYKIQTPEAKGDINLYSEEQRTEDDHIDDDLDRVYNFDHQTAFHLKDTEKTVSVDQINDALNNGELELGKTYTLEELSSILAENQD